MYHGVSPVDGSYRDLLPVPPTRIGRILVVEDDAEMRRSILSHLRDHQCDAAGCGSSEVARHVQSQTLSLILVDARLGAFSGLDILRQIRARSGVPVMLYGDRSQADVERIIGLELGADDFLCAPLNVHEVLARTRAILRRQDLGRLGIGALRGGYGFRGWELRHATRTLTAPGGEPVGLTKKEYALLVALLEMPGRPLSRLHLMRATRAHEDIYDRSIDVQVLRLRRKLEADPSGIGLIRTDRGVGYIFDAEVEALF
ncbi:DNA-binding response regulator [Nostoc sp. 3335mG]|nr:DNA-binding response regulator [Nostoc sp. 3335mG]